MLVRPDCFRYPDHLVVRHLPILPVTILPAMGLTTDKTVWDRRRLEAPHAQPDKAQRVRRMFDAIAPTYELVNTLGSLGRDRRWRREMVRLAQVRPEDILLDVACGTGDVSRTFAAGHPRPAAIVGADFSGPMLRLAGGRPIDLGLLVQADALRLPLPDARVTIVSCAFGIRNFQNLDVGLREMYRVLKPGGRAVILEFSVPVRTFFRRIYLLYVGRILPLLASLVSGDRTGAYRYLHRSVLSFHDREEIVSSLRSAGFAEVTVHPLSWGIVAVYVACKAPT
jgi:demethylmenaquinone methyltransferase / 2-methoxy-6-polyprenyl-1,4-benzoquinol methylase